MTCQVVLRTYVDTQNCIFTLWSTNLVFKPLQPIEKQAENHSPFLTGVVIKDTFRLTIFSKHRGQQDVTLILELSVSIQRRRSENLCATYFNLKSVPVANLLSGTIQNKRKIVSEIEIFILHTRSNLFTIYLKILLIRFIVIVSWISVKSKTFQSKNFLNLKTTLFIKREAMLCV